MLQEERYKPHPETLHSLPSSATHRTRSAHRGRTVRPEETYKRLEPMTSEKERSNNQPFIKPVALAADIAEEARTLWRGTVGLKKWQDAVHLASALRWNIETMHTYDHQDLIHLSGKLSCRNGKPLHICYPDETTDGPLFAKSQAGS